MADRVRMKSKTVMNNPLITSHAEGRADPHTVIEGDEFSTSEDHAQQLKQSGYAERIRGEAAPASEDAGRIAGFQTSADNAIQSNRASKKADAKAAV